MTRKMLLSQVITHIIVMLGIVVLSIIFSPDNFESSFLGQWYVANSIIYYLQYLIPTTATGLLITFSIQLLSEDLGAGQSFFKLIQSTLVFLLTVMIAYTLLLFLVLPWAYQQRADAGFRSDFVNQRIEQAVIYMDEGEYREADRMIADVLSLIPQHNDAVDLFWLIQEHITPEEIEPPQPQATPTVSVDLSYGEILDKARNYYEAGDWYSAVFYARLALGPDEQRVDRDARRILSESLIAISTLEPDAEESAEREIFNLKQRAVNAYDAGQYLDSYYGFRALQDVDPGDPDLETYLNFLIPRVEEISFFLDELDEANQADIRRNVFFKLPAAAMDMSMEGTSFVPQQSSGNTSEIFLSAEQLMRSSRGLYFINMEFLELSPEGAVIQHISVPMGKMSGNVLITRAIDRNDSENRYEASYRTGNPVRGEEAVLRFGISASEIWAVNPATRFYNDVNILQLFSLAQQYPEFGRNPLFPQSEILYRLLLPFSLINICLMIVGMAWKGRSHYLSGPPLYLYVFLPIVPLFILGMYDLYVLIFRNLLSAMLILSSFLVAIITLIGLQAVVFLVVMLFLSRLQTDT